jgi:hypothetical protein
MQCVRVTDAVFENAQNHCREGILGEIRNRVFDHAALVTWPASDEPARSGR